MKIQEIINEAHNRGDMKSVLTARGYKLLGTGYYATVWQAPNGTILKVFSASEEQDYHDKTWLAPNYKQYPDDLKDFLMFYHYVKQHPSPYLPKFGKLKRVTVDNREYVIVTTEPLSATSTNPKTEDAFRSIIVNGGATTWEGIIEDNPRDVDILNKYGPRTFMPVALLAAHLSSISPTWDFSDHLSRNIMFRGDIPIINDPW
jgi:hypothetical protein